MSDHFWLQAFDLNRATGDVNWYDVRNPATKFGEYATLAEAHEAAKAFVKPDVVCRINDDEGNLVGHVFPASTVGGAT